MYLERYGLETIEYKMKLVGTPQWAIGIQYSAAWIGFNVDRVHYYTLEPACHCLLISYQCTDKSSQQHAALKTFLW